MLSPLALYQRLPVPLQNLACSVQGWRDARVRYSRFFQTTLASLLESERLSAVEIASLQDERLRSLIAHVYETVPYYRTLMRGLRITPADIQGAGDLPKLPILTKEQVRANFDQLQSAAVPSSRRILRHTSGTTGKSLAFYSSAESIAFQWAIWWRHRSRFGLYPGDLHANFTGKLVVPAAQQRPPFWRWNWPARQALINMQHVTPGYAPAIVSFLSRRPFVFYSGYPSIIHALAVTAGALGLSLASKPRVIATGAEPMHEFQRRDIAAFTGAILTDQWGFSEGAGNASQCEHFRYHEDSEFGIIECVDPEPLPDGRVGGRLVCTGFADHAFPFLRYEVGDSAVWEPPTFRCPCGRQSRVLASIDGRNEDYVLTTEGHRIARFDYIFKETEHVKECQVVQAAPGEVTLRIVRRPEYDKADERLLLSEMARWISPSLIVHFEYVSEIERGPNGKFRAVKSLLRGTTGAEPTRQDSTVQE
jgi:phenylacetate-CoA ligase